jgi:hypothetical protein
VPGAGAQMSRVAGEVFANGVWNRQEFGDHDSFYWARKGRKTGQKDKNESLS